MDILIDNQQTNQPIRTKAIQKKARAILNALDCPDGELSIVIVDDTRIADLNQTYLQHSGPTNVISFPMREGDFSEINPHVLGDVVISADTCAREAEEAGIATEARLDQLLIHGILHLFGYDHVHSESDARTMEAKSDDLLALLKTLSFET
jgi:probable rRNA maturation factor